MAWATCVLCCSDVEYETISCFVQLKVHIALCHWVRCDVILIAVVSVKAAEQTFVLILFMNLKCTFLLRVDVA
jgi:hypothetical protein